jgi:hypothetical protein
MRAFSVVHWAQHGGVRILFNRHSIGGIMKDEVLLDIEVADGKYRIIQTRLTGTHAYRYPPLGVPPESLGEESREHWLHVTLSPGSNMILAMAYELDELRNLLNERQANNAAD